jgi:hypothetical protein
VAAQHNELYGPRIDNGATNEVEPTAKEDYKERGQGESPTLTL